MAMWLLAAATSLVASLHTAPRTVPLSSIRRASFITAQEVSLAAPTTFQELRRLDDRVRRLETTGIAALSGFYEADTNCFSLTPGRDRVSLTSTCYSLYAINAAPGEWRQSPLRIQECLKTLLAAEQRDDDTMQAVLIVAAARLMDPGESATNSKLATSIEAMLLARPRRREGRSSPISAYLRFWLAYATSLLPGVALPDGGAAPAASTALLTLQRACDSAYDDLCRQLAFDAAGDAYSFDVVVLAYSLLTYVLVLDRLEGITARERETGARDAIGTGSSLPPRNDKLIRAGLAIIFGQLSNGLWAPGQPIILSRGAGNNVGNAFCFAPDMLASMLEILPADLFRAHLGSIAEHVTWLEEHLVEEALPGGATLRGWRSNHLPPEGGPLGWCTAQALRCASNLPRPSTDLPLTFH